MAEEAPKTNRTGVSDVAVQAAPAADSDSCNEAAANTVNGPVAGTHPEARAAAAPVRTPRLLCILRSRRELARGLRPILPAGSERDKGRPMRSPNGPLFKTYEIIAIVAFLTAAAAWAGLKLVY